MPDYNVNSEPIVKTLRMCSEEPERALHLLNEAEENEWFVAGKVIAYSQLITQPFIEENVPLSSSGAEFLKQVNQILLNYVKKLFMKSLKLNRKKLN